MTLASLATVELQLCMHGLDQRSLLLFARCSRFTLAAASNPFAWVHLPVASVSSRHFHSADSISRSLIRFSRGLHLLLTPVQEDAEPMLALRAPAKLHTLSSMIPADSPIPLVSLTIGGSRHAPWLSTVSHADVARLRVLRLEVDIEHVFFSRFMHVLPCLETLWYHGRINQHLVEALPNMDRLTDLTLWIGDVFNVSIEQLLQCITRCCQLRRLALSRMRAEDMETLLSAPLLQLHTLELADVLARSPSQRDATIDFAQLDSLSALREIRLTRCPNVAWIIRPTKMDEHMLDVTSRRLVFAPANARELPSTENLHLALEALPGLTVQIELHPAQPAQRDSSLHARLRGLIRGDPQEPNASAVLETRAQQLRAVDPSRVSVSQPRADDCSVEGPLATPTQSCVIA